MEGLYNKYIIKKTNGEPIDPKAKYFVLRLDTDPHAKIAMLQYILSVRKENPKLAKDLEEYLNNGKQTHFRSNQQINP